MSHGSTLFSGYELLTAKLSSSSIWLFVNTALVVLGAAALARELTAVIGAGYVPYLMWGEADSRLSFLLQKSLQNARHELLVGNCAGIPTLLQHGGADDNVPAFHSRRMNQLVSQSAGAVSSRYVELEGKGHYFDGVMTTIPLRNFYYDVLGGKTKWPAIPLNFSIIVANPADMGPRAGLIVDQLVTPDQLGKIDVKRSLSLDRWTLRTSNIHRFHFVPSANPPSEVEIDEDCLKLPAAEMMADTWLARSGNDHWQVN